MKHNLIMSRNSKITLIATLLALLTACAGGGGGGSASAPYLLSSTGQGTFYGSHQLLKTYSNGQTSTLNPNSGPATTWSVDHITRTDTYSYSDGSTASWDLVVQPTSTIPSINLASYSPDWTTTGSVTPPNVGNITNTYGDGYTSTQDGTALKPFLQTNLSALSVTDPNAYVSSSTATYNLTWGTPDKNGPSYVSLYPNSSTHLPFNLNYMGVAVSGQGVIGPTLVQPSADVLDAWSKGWTGKGINLLTIDDYSSVSACNSALSCHGITTMMISDLVAPGASKFGLDWNRASIGKDINGFSINSLTQMQVINMSFADTQAYADSWVSFLQQVNTGLNVGTAQAVLVKAADNNFGQDTYSTLGGDYLVKALVDNPNTLSRLLIVGALNKNGSVSSPATIASYSSYAGSNPVVQNRFVVANGNAPYALGGVAINGTSMPGYNTVPGSQGTSFAAPVVAGYAAVLMQKFPNLSAASTSNIILDTARTDTLTCNPNCDPAIYGRGEASLSRALAPVGKLR